MVRPVLQGKVVVSAKKYCSHISGLYVGWSKPLALMESAHTHLIRSTASMGPRPRQVQGVQVLPFMPSLLLYLRNSLMTVSRLCSI